MQDAKQEACWSSKRNDHEVKVMEQDPVMGGKPASSCIPVSLLSLMELDI